MSSKCIIPIDGPGRVLAEMSNLSTHRTATTPLIYATAVRRLEWTVAIADIEQHLYELWAVGIIKSDEVNAHRVELSKKAMAVRSPPRPTPVRAHEFAAISALMDLCPEPEAVHPPVSAQLPAPTIMVLTTNNNVTFAIPRHFTSVYRHIGSVVDYRLCGPEPHATPVPFIVTQVSEIDTDVPAQPPICPPAPCRVTRSRPVQRDPLTGRPACAKRLQF